MKNVILMRHSIAARIDLSTEKIPLSEEGRKSAARIKNKMIKYSIRKVFSSNYLRAIQTAEMIGFPFEVMEDLHERTIGCETPNFWYKQYFDLNYKNQGGESLNEVKDRMYHTVINLVTKSNDGDSILIISHATAIFSFLMNYCSVGVVDSEEKIRSVIFHNEKIFEGKFNPTDFFVMQFNESNKLEKIYFNL